VIRVTDIDGCAHFLAAARVAHVQEARASSRWHGIHAFVKTVDGQMLEVREEATEIAAAVAKGAESELLEALQPFVERNSSEETITITARTADVTRARAAIARATGGTS
jgi:hypothetical protein